MKSIIVFSVLCAVRSSHQLQQRNVVVIMADDLAYNDLSFRGSNEIPTPNIDSLAYNGVIMNRFYTPPLCTPSRGSVMTGKYPHRLGLQSYVIPSDEPWSLGKEEKILPQYFKEAGYKTSLIGKWHLGFYQQQFTPWRRGFDTVFGYLGPYIDYWDYTLKDFHANYSRGYDMRRNLSVVDDVDKVYVTNLFTSEAVKVIENHDKNKPMFMMLNHLAPHAGNEDFPMQAPEDEIARFANITNYKRRVLAAMVSILDQSVGTVVQALRDNKLLENTVIVFYSDNGGPTVGMHSTNASNYPLRGQKNSGWEGGIRTNAVIYAPFLQNPRAIRNQLMHVSDLFPTLLKLAGVRTDSRWKLDGVDQWNVISLGSRPVRNEVVSFDDVFGFGAFITQNYKLVNGSSDESGATDTWLGSKNNNGNNDPIDYALSVLSSPASRAILSIQTGNRLGIDKILELRKAATVRCTNGVEKTPCDPYYDGPCLFNIVDDPCEENNLARSRISLLRSMKMRYDALVKQAVPSSRRPADSDADPIFFNGNWEWWQKDT